MVWLLLDGPVPPNTGKGMKHLSLVLAGLSTPLVLSVHTIVSFDFATSVVPGWHTTIFPPYFVAGAIFSRICHGAIPVDYYTKSVEAGRIYYA